MNAPCSPVTSCIIEPDALQSQTAFYDAKAEVLYFWRKPYNTELVL